MKHFYSLLIVVFLLSAAPLQVWAGSVEEEEYAFVTGDIQLVIFPNPVRSEATITYSPEVERIAILNLVGREVMGFTVNSAAGVIQIDLSQLQPGVYFITAQSQGRNLVTKRFMKEQ